nr:retrovirus-related Pol polyprotein from transposon TNT 1-94 [Tanacetum cinerariifolium]
MGFETKGDESSDKTQVLVVKPHFKTLYKLFKGKLHALSFMRPFSCHVTTLNTLDQLGKFDGKLDEGIFVGYSTISKAFKVHNTRTRKVEENLHITFLKNKPIIAGKGANFDAGQSSLEIGPSQDYILMPLWKDSSLFNSSSQDSDGHNKDKHSPSQESECDNQERPNAESSTKNFNTDGPSINTTNANDNTSSLNINTATPTYADYPSDPLMPYLEDTRIFNDAYDDRDEGAEADYNNLETVISATQGHRQEEGIDCDELFAPFAQIKAIRYYELKTKQKRVFSGLSRSRVLIIQNQDEVVKIFRARKRQEREKTSPTMPSDLIGPARVFNGGNCPGCSNVGSENEFVYDPNPYSYNETPNFFNQLRQHQYETYSCELYGDSPHYGFDCQTRTLLVYEQEPCYNQNFSDNYYPQNSSSFPQQYLCSDNCGGPHETFQCQPLNQNFYEPNHFYKSNSFGFDQSQPSQFPIIHQPPQETSVEILHDQENVINSVQTFLRKFNRYSFFETPKVLLLAWDRVSEIKDAFRNKQYKPEEIKELFRKLFTDVQNIHEELAEYINTPSWNRPAFYNNDEDDDEDYTIAITPDFPITDSLSMGDEHLSTISETKSDELIKYSVENLVSILSESEDFFDIVSECNVPVGDDFTTFSNSLFDSNGDCTSSDDESFSDENVPMEVYLNPLFKEEIISTKIDPHHFNAEFDLIESLLNHDTSIISSSKIDSLLEEFLYDNSSPRPPKEFNSENSDVIIESFSPSPISIKDSDPFMEEIDLFLAYDGSIPPSIDSAYSDFEGDNLLLERLLHDDPIPLSDIPDFSNVV